MHKPSPHRTCQCECKLVTFWFDCIPNVKWTCWRRNDAEMWWITYCSLEKMLGEVPGKSPEASNIMILRTRNERQNLRCENIIILPIPVMPCIALFLTVFVERVILFHQAKDGSQPIWHRVLLFSRPLLKKNEHFQHNNLYYIALLPLNIVYELVSIIDFLGSLQQNTRI